MYKMDTRNPLSQISYALALTYTSKIDEACSFFDQMIQDDPEGYLSTLASFYSYALKNDVEQAKNSVSDEFLATSETDEYYSLKLAEGFALIEEKQEALKWLENSVNGGLVCYPFLNEYDPFLENIRGEPRFKKLMERVKHEWENFEV